MPRIAIVQPSAARKGCFIALAALAVVLAVEAIAAVFLGIAEGRWLGLDAVAKRRDGLAEHKIPAPLMEAGIDRFGAPETLHPYVGFVNEPVSTLSDEPAPGWSPKRPAFEDRLIYEPSDQRLVIGVLGGSVADIAANGGAGLAGELRRISRFKGRELHVISLAQGGFKQPQQVTLLAYLLALGAHFDLVLNIDGFNEVALPAAEMVARDVFAYYPRAWEQRVGPLDSEPRRVALSLHQSRQRRRELAERFSGWPWRMSQTATFLWHALDDRRSQDIAALARSLLSSRSRDIAYSSHGPRRTYDSEEVMYEEFARFWFRSSLQLHHLCRGQGIEYRHFLQPNQYTEGAKDLTAERAAGKWRADHPYRPAVEAGYPHLIELGRELTAQGVQFTDLTTIFAEREELVYSDSCCHYNFFGNTQLQRTIARHLDDDPATRGRPENLSFGGLALEGYDPVSYFDHRPTRGSAEITATHDGILYRFVHPDHRARFLAEPERYLPRFGGWCAFGLGFDEDELQVPRERYPVDPESYEILDGELYLFYRSSFIDGRELWRREPETYRRQAEETWRRLTESGL